MLENQNPTFGTKKIIFQYLRIYKYLHIVPKIELTIAIWQNSIYGKFTVSLKVFGFKRGRGA